MKLGIKLTYALISFVLALGLLVVGVFASSMTKVNIHGTVSFVANDVYAKVTGTITGTFSSDDVNLSELNFSSTKMPTDDELATWENKSLNFLKKDSVIKIEIVVQNLSNERSIYCSLKGDAGLKDNVNKVLKNSGNNYQSESIIEIKPTLSTTFAVEMNVYDTNYSIRNIAYDYVLTLNNDPTSTPTPTPAEEKEVDCLFTSDTVDNLVMTKTTNAPIEGENVYEIASEGMTYAYMSSGKHDVTSKISSGTNLTLKYCISAFSLVYGIQINGEDVDYDMEEGDEYIFITIEHTVEENLSITFDASLSEM